MAKASVAREWEVSVQERGILPKVACGRAHCGLTLVELLVVLTIISILLSLLLVGVHALRERTRLAQCQARVTQLAMATQNHIASHRFFPSNGWGFKWIGIPERGFGVKQPGGWAFQLLPMLEISQELALSVDGTHPELPMFRCPSRPSASLGKQTVAFTPINSSFVGLVARTDYAICEGDYVTDTDGGPPSLQIGDSPSYQWTDTKRASGISFLRSRIRTSEVTDGLTSTLLFGEKQVSTLHYDDGNDLGYDQSLFSGVDLDLNRWTIWPPMRDSSVSHSRQFGAAHPTGIVAAYCDGSVRIVSFDIDLLTFQTSGNRADHGRMHLVP